MSTNIPFDGAGMADIQTDSFKSVNLFAGEAPIVTTSETVAAATIASADLPAFSVVGRDGSGNLVMAVLDTATPANNIAPIGITCSPVLKGATNKGVAVYRGGFFNMDALNWDASFDTAAKKRVAFEASQPLIFIGTVPTYGD